MFICADGLHMTDILGWVADGIPFAARMVSIYSTHHLIPTVSPTRICPNLNVDETLPSTRFQISPFRK